MGASYTAVGGVGEKLSALPVTRAAISEEQAEAERELIREAASRILAGDSLPGTC